jgi:hypothetical protein
MVKSVLSFYINHPIINKLIFIKYRRNIPLWYIALSSTLSLAKILTITILLSITIHRTLTDLT